MGAGKRPDHGRCCGRRQRRDFGTCLPCVPEKGTGKGGKGHPETTPRVPGAQALALSAISGYVRYVPVM